MDKLFCKSYNSQTQINLLGLEHKIQLFIEEAWLFS